MFLNVLMLIHLVLSNKKRNKKGVLASGQNLKPSLLRDDYFIPFCAIFVKLRWVLRITRL